MTFHEAIVDPTVLKQYETALATCRQTLPTFFNQTVELSFQGRRQVESHIEAIFLIWWNAISQGTFHGSMFSRLRLEPQVDVQFEHGTYRLDFRVRTDDEMLIAVANRVGLAEPRIGIELDGHEFHERTKAQATSRNRRDRDLQAAGWKVFHISGSEVVREPSVSVGEVVDHASDAYTSF